MNLGNRRCEGCEEKGRGGKEIDTVLMYEVLRREGSVLRTLAALQKDPGLNPRTPVVASSYPQLQFQGI